MTSSLDVQSTIPKLYSGQLQKPRNKSLSKGSNVRFIQIGVVKYENVKQEVVFKRSPSKAPGVSVAVYALKPSI